MLTTFLQRGERIAIIENNPGHVRASMLSVASHGAKFLKYIYAETLLDLIPLIHTKRFGTKPHVIVLHATGDVVTFSGSVRVQKYKEHVALSEEHLKELFTKASLLFFSRFKEEAKRALKTKDVEVVLAGHRYRDLHLDGAVALSPIGAAPKEAELFMEQTFVRREALDVASVVFQEAKSITHLDAAYAATDYLARVAGSGTFRAALMFRDATHIVQYTEKPSYFGASSFCNIERITTLPTGGGALVGALASSLGGSAKLAEELLRALYRGTASSAVRRYVHKALEKELIALTRSLAPHTKNERFYLFADEPLLSAIATHPRARGFLFPAREKFESIAHAEPLPALVHAGFIAHLERTGDNYLERFNGGALRWMLPENPI